MELGKFGRSHPVVYWFYIFPFYIYFSQYNYIIKAIIPPQEGKATRRQKPSHYCTKKPANVSQKKLTRQDATDPKQKAVNRLQRTSGQAPPQTTGKLKSRRTNTTTTDITTRCPTSEQRPQEIARGTYLTLIELQQYNRYVMLRTNHSTNCEPSGIPNASSHIVKNFMVFSLAWRWLFKSKHVALTYAFVI